MLYSIDAPGPRLGEPLRLEFGGLSWLLERNRQGVHCRVQWDAGEGEDLRFDGLLGMPEEGCWLRFDALAAQQPVELSITTDLALMPGGQLRGYLGLPLILRLSALTMEPRRVGEQVEGLELLRLPEPGLRLGWREREGYFHPWESALLARPGDGGPLDACRLWLRTRLRNLGDEVVRTRRCRIELDGLEARLLRRFAFAPAMEWCLGPRSSIRFRHLPEMDAPFLEREEASAAEEAPEDDPEWHPDEGLAQ
jgi:hypothetical protein